MNCCVSKKSISPKAAASLSTMRLEVSASHFEVLPREYSIMVYGQHPSDYIASCQIMVCGDRGVIHSATGAGWYRHWAQPGAVDRLLAATGVKTLEGYATEAHARLMRHALRHVAQVSIGAIGKMAGRTMVYVTVESKIAQAEMRNA